MSSNGNWGGPSGFSLLVWEDEPEIDLSCKENLDPAVDEEDLVPTTTLSSGDRLILPSLLEDAKCLLLGRWGGISVEEHVHKGQHYLWVVCTRFSVGDETVKRALGDLMHHLSFQRGAPNADFHTAVRYKLCRERWGVPQQIVERPEAPESSAKKRLRL